MHVMKCLSLFLYLCIFNHLPNISSFRVRIENGRNIISKKRQPVNIINALGRIKTKSRLHSSSLTPIELDWSFLSTGDTLSAENSTQFDLLDAVKYPPTIISLDELKSMWLQKSMSVENDSFSVIDSLSLVMSRNSHISIIDERSQTHTDDEIYITEIELLRIWKEASLRPFGKSLSQFNTEEALLLIPDEDDYDKIVEETHVSNDGDTSDINLFDDVEIFVTADELGRLWQQRGEVAWGMPGKEFDEKLALLILDEDDDDTDYVSAIHANVRETDENGFWNKLSDPADSVIRESLRELYMDLEDQTHRRPAWKKSSNALTPDIETQSFYGDIMNSNTYMTTKIPANWNDPESDDMSETYHSANTMALPGEPETDYNIKLTPWEALGLPIGPKYARKVESKPAVEEVDWNTFDFSQAEVPKVVDESDDDEDGSNNGREVEADPLAEDLDVDAFFRKLDPIKPEEDDDLGSDVDIMGSDAIEVELLDSIAPANQDDIPWVTPQEWLNRPEFANHVGYEVWGQYDHADFLGADDRYWDEDIYYALSMKHVLEVTDLYLTRHDKLSDVMTDRRYWTRVINAAVTGSEDLKEPIPSYLTPDKNRGVTYSDEIIEMKSKKTLHAYLDPPQKLWENDTFTHNEDISPVMMTGTIREQYDWTPTVDPSEYRIDPDVLEHIQPVLRMANHIARLKSTKNNTLIFEYRGQMRHIVGIRATLLQCAQECFPELVDLRLETEVMCDNHDI